MSQLNVAVKVQEFAFLHRNGIFVSLRMRALPLFR